MGKDKLRRWAENKTMPHVHEPPLLPIIREGKTYLKGEWHKQVFENENPITIELGCGKGEYTIGLARMYPNRNFIGIDVKGHRFHKGAREAQMGGLTNVAFLRTRIEFIESFFDQNEIAEIWLTFSDPQPQDKTGVRRMTSLHFAQKYRTFLRAGGFIHIKHDNPEVYRKALLEFSTDERYAIALHHPDIYNGFTSTLNDEWKNILEIRTYYETMWLSQGRETKYIRIQQLK
jgi:tRNA (guanine-N7-)-methyltransferase